MRIAIDLQGIQSEGSRSRGIGRYSLEIVKSIICNAPDDEYILVANASMCDLQIEFQDQLEQKNVFYFNWYSPTPIDFFSKQNILIQLGIYLRSYAFSLLNADLIFITSFLEGYTDNCLTDIDNDFLDAPIVSIFYDLIPLLNQKLYLKPNPDFSKFYKSKLESFKTINALLAISESSANEAINFLHFNSKNVFNISSACNKNIFNTLSKTYQESSHISNTFLPYILYSGAADPRKNVRGLFEAYSDLPNEISIYNLVLVGKLIPAEIELINEWIKTFDIDPKKIILTGYISDQDLVEFYRNCSLFVFPSFHEGFGLPVLEAMSCGAPVIASNTTSIPEVISLSKAMFDPGDVKSLRDLMHRALTDNDFREELIVNSKIQSNKFSWQATGLRAIKAFKRISDDFQYESTPKDRQSFSILNNTSLHKLLKKISQKPKLKSLIRDQFYLEIASSLDKICTQARSINMYFSSEKCIKSWRVEGPFDSSYSLAILNRFFLESLSKKIDNVSLLITEGYGNYEPNLTYLNSFPKTYNIYKDSLKKDAQVDVISRNLYPPRVNDLDAKVNLFHSYGWEESEFPRDWVLNFNTFLQGISVMSIQVKKILIDNGVSIPVKVTSLGLDHLDDIHSDQSFTVKAKKYKILHISSCFPRKGIEILLNAFGKIFTIEDNVSLIIKTFVNPHNQIEDLLAEAQKNNIKYPHVVILYEELNNEQLKSLYLQSDMLVAPSRGEGFGLPIGEAMRLGIPVITTGWGGQKDFCNDSNCWLIDYEFSHSKSHFKLDLSYWADPYVNDLVKQIKTVYSSNNSDLLKKTLKAKEVTNSFTWEKVANENMNFVEQLFSIKSNRHSKIGWMSTWFSKCGIASYSSHLIEKMCDYVEIFTPINECNVSNESYNIHPSWELNSDNKDQFNTLVSLIKSLNITTYVIQFNYGFFQFDYLEKLIVYLNQNDINTIVFLHSTRDPHQFPNKELKSLSSAFSNCARLIVHTISDLNRLKSIGLIDNVTLLPHGIPQAKNDSINSKKYFPIKKYNSIATFGFCLPNKGYLELIRAISILKEQSFNLKLNIYSAFYGKDYDWYYQKMKDEIRILGLSAEITLDPNYYSENEIFTRLALNDLIVFPYQSSSESSSASVRMGLSSGQPVLVTPLSIFDDVSELVDYMPGVKSEDLANGISKWFTQDISQDLLIQRNKLIQQRSFSLIASRFSSLIKSIEVNKEI